MLDCRTCLVVVFALIACLTSALAEETTGSRALANGYLGPPTPGTCYWSEREFKDIPERGPALATGIILWSHGQATGHPSWQYGAPPVIRLFAERGWDVFLVQRNPRCEGSWPAKGREYVDNLVNEVLEAKKRGYRRVLVAGQSVGAGIALGASGGPGQIEGVMAFALSHGRRSCRDARTIRPGMIPFHEKQIEKAIRESRSPRILISMGRDDHCVGYSFSPLISSALAKKSVAYIHLDESMAIAGHGAATGTEFASLYGDCVLEFFSDDELTKGRHTCAVKQGLVR